MQSRGAVGAADAAAARVYSHLRGGGIETGADLWDELAALGCLLFDWGQRDPAVVEVLELRRQDVDDAGLRVLAHRVLGACGFDPGFRLAPERLDRLHEALDVAARDLPAQWSTEEPRLVVTTMCGESLEQAVIELSGGYVHGTPIWPRSGDTEASARAAVAELLQEVTMERRRTVWPVCLVHDLGLHAELADGAAVWHCSGGDADQKAGRRAASGHVVADIGALR